MGTYQKNIKSFAFGPRVRKVEELEDKIREINESMDFVTTPEYREVLHAEIERKYYTDFDLKVRKENGLGINHGAIDKMVDQRINRKLDDLYDQLDAIREELDVCGDKVVEIRIRF